MVELFAGSASVDFRDGLDNSANMLFVDGSEDRVGINNQTPGAPLDVVGDINLVTELTYYFSCIFRTWWSVF